MGGLRVFEICDARMGGFFSRRGADGRERWWLEITGKGSKTRLVPATGELMAELMRYRKVHALSPLPLEGESTPLVMTLIAPVKPMARSAIHQLVKGVMRDAAVALRRRGPDFEAAAAHLEQAPTHWIRHTAESHLSEKVDLKVVRDKLGHASGDRRCYLPYLGLKQDMSVRLLVPAALDLALFAWLLLIQGVCHCFEPPSLAVFSECGVKWCCPCSRPGR